jgi:aspartyl-tRNA(Asn)/glutamyl-tRNA(Gln) amidotransferase subunit C
MLTSQSYNPGSVASEPENRPTGQGFEAKQVAQLSRLSRLGLSPQELEKLASQLALIIAAVNKLAEADTSGVDPTAQVGGLSNVWRADEVEAGLSAEEALANASVKEAGLLRVPAIQ